MGHSKNLSKFAKSVKRAARVEGKDVTDWEPLNSSHLLSCRHSQLDGFLDITFQSGMTYRYNNVPEETYIGLINANSPGRYFHGNIKPRFLVTRLS